MEETRRTRAVFLDRDGVINVYRKDYVRSWEQFAFLDGSLEGLAILARLGFKLVVISNQSAIGRNLVARQVVDDIHQRMKAEIERAGGTIAALYYCPHTPEEDCGCRKPQSGMLIQAAGELSLDLAGSYLVGDALDDLICGQRVGCETVLVRTGRGEDETRRLADFRGDQPAVVDNLLAAANWIRAREAHDSTRI